MRSEFLKKFILNFKNPPHPPHPPLSILPATTVPPRNCYNPPHSLRNPQKAKNRECDKLVSALPTSGGGFRVFSSDFCDRFAAHAV